MKNYPNVQDASKSISFLFEMTMTLSERLDWILCFQKILKKLLPSNETVLLNNQNMDVLLFKIKCKQKYSFIFPIH